MSHIQLLPRQLLDLILFSSMKVIFALYLASAGIVDQKYKRKAIVHLSSLLLLPFSHGRKPGASPFTHFDDPAGSVSGRQAEALHRRCLAAREVTLGDAVWLGSCSSRGSWSRPGLLGCREWCSSREFCTTPFCLTVRVGVLCFVLGDIWKKSKNHSKQQTGQTACSDHFQISSSALMCQKVHIKVVEQNIFLSRTDARGGKFTRSVVRGVYLRMEDWNRD